MVRSEVSLFADRAQYPLTNSNHRYDPHPTQETLIRAVSISRRWSIQNLYDYAFDHLKRQFHHGLIHPAVVLGVAREWGIPDLIEPAVKALADLERPFSSWSTDADVTCYTSVADLGVIGRMKEKLLMARITLCTPPRPVHDDSTCLPEHRTTCSALWKEFWSSNIVPRLLRTGGNIEDQLLWIRDVVARASIAGMGDRCVEWTVNEAIGKPGWRAEMNIPDGAVKLLMVPERVMLAPDDGFDAPIS
jgi:hypothetical protein